MRRFLDDAIERNRRDQFFKELNASYIRLQQDTKVWNEELAERREWDTTLGDGLDSE